MPEIADILALFGRIDEIAGEHSDNPGVLSIIERLLPDTTGYQQGWYRQIQRFFEEISLDRTSPLPTYSAALNSLGTDEDEAWTVPQQAKARYAAVVLIELHGEIRSRQVDEERIALENMLTSSGARFNVPQSDTFRELIFEERPSHDQWRQFMNTAARRTDGIVTEDEVRINPPAKGKIKVVGDDFATQLDTSYHDPDLDIEDVKAVLDPLNWKHCCPYWKEVKPSRPDKNAENWSRIWEVVGPGKDVADIHLTTALVNRKDEVNYGAIVNYDLDTDLEGTEHDGYVLVDNGFIWATPIRPGTKPSGVRVRTRKVARIQGMGVTALAMYAYTMGWSTVGENMLLGCARRPPAKPARKPWKASDRSPHASPPKAPKATPQIPQIKADDRKAMIDAAVKAATKAADDRATKLGDLVESWLEGKLKAIDLQDAAADAGRYLAETQFGFHQAVSLESSLPSPPDEASEVKSAKSTKQGKTK